MAKKTEDETKPPVDETKPPEGDAPEVENPEAEVEEPEPPPKPKRQDTTVKGGRYINERGRITDAHGNDLGPAPKRR